MKTKLIYLVIMLLLLGIGVSGYSEDCVGPLYDICCGYPNYDGICQRYYLYVYVSNENLKPNLESNGVIGNERINEIFRDFGVIGYRQSFPGANNDSLLNWYEIHFTGNVDLFIEALAQENAFGEIYKGEYYRLASNQPVVVNYVGSGLTIRQTARMLRIAVPNQMATPRPEIALYNLAGKRQNITPVFNADRTISVALSGFAAGSYIVRVNDGRNRWDRRVLVK